ncbi:MBL fold metallo-hydrolase [Candidatus Parcubacteria bacterium]|nr:MBL fold metallo-hydrolase [Candidatus Parcubacteria bacterium]
MTLTFCGGARAVTGANYLIAVDGEQILVDCGLTQGTSFAEAKNFEPFGYDPASIRALLLTHAHADHVGRVPKLVREGFRGKVFATPPTIELARLILEDSQQVMAKEAELTGGPVLYQLADVKAVEPLWRAVDYHERIEVAPGVAAMFRDAGHMLGAASIALYVAEGRGTTTLVFSGDLGNAPTPILRAPERISSADWLVVESVYGDRRHEDRENRRAKLLKIVRSTIERRGVLMIPVFAVERTQELLFELNDFVEGGHIQRVPMFLDSPLAIRATEVYRKYPQYFNRSAGALVASGDDLFRFPGLVFTETKEASIRINDVPAPKIILAGSGMTQGGRIHHHLIRYLPDPKSTFLSVGYHVAGSIGRRLLEGETELELRGERIPVAARVEAIGGYSGHADRAALCDWVRPMAATVRQIFVVQGEVHASEALAQSLQTELRVAAVVPASGETVELG